MKKRILSLFLCLALILGMLPIQEMQVQAAGTVMEKTLPVGADLVITADELGVEVNPSVTTVYTWKIKNGSIDYTGAVNKNEELLTKPVDDRFVIYNVEGKCILDGATVSLTYRNQSEGTINWPTTVLISAEHTPAVAEETEDDTWFVGDTQHYHKCAECDTEYGHETHTPGDWMVDKEATEEETGSCHKECTVCGKVMETEVIQQLECTHTIRRAEWSYNEKNHYHLCLCGYMGGFDSEKHIAGDWILDQAATADVAGKRHKECTVCHYKMSEETISYEASVIKSISVNGIEIPKAGQDYADVENNPEDLTYGGAYVMDYIKYEVYDADEKKWTTLGEDTVLTVETDYRMEIGLSAEAGFTFETDESKVNVSVNELAGSLKEVTDENTYAVIYRSFRHACVHDFKDKIESDEYLVPGSGSDCKDPYKYYYACDVCGAKSPELTWESKVYGAHDLSEENYCDTCDATIYNIWVGSKEVTSKNASDVFGDETVSYNPETNVLTLNGYCNEGEVHVFEEDYYAAIYSEGDLNLELEGENYITENEDSEEPVYGLMSFDGDVTISGKGALDVSTYRMIFSPQGGVTISDGNIELNGAGYAITGLTVEIAGGYTMMHGQDICVLVGNEGKTLELTGGSVDMYAYSKGDFICNVTDSEMKAPDLSNYKGYIAAAAVATISGPQKVEYNPENIGDYVGLFFEKIPDDLALTSVEIKNVIFPKAGELVDDIKSPWETATYGGNYEICELGWYFENAEGEMEGIDYDVPMQEGKEYYLHLTVETPYESGFPTDLDKEKITVNGIKAQDITIVYGPQYLSFYIPFYPEHVHSYGNVWQKDAANHWKECKCGEKSDVAKHTFDAGVVTKEPTEKETGVKTYTCTVCKATKTETLPVKEPELPAKNATLTDAKTGMSFKVINAEKSGGTVSFKAPKNKKVTSVSIPATVTINDIVYKVTEIEKNAFSGCSKLKSVTIGKNVTKIGDKAFYKCKALTKITIPSKVTKIGKSAFYGCKKLKKIIIKTTKLKASSVGKNAFKGTPKSATVKVPKKSVKAYKKFLYKKGLHKKAKITK